MKIKDIAKLANVSVSTVSKVLMNHSDVAPSTRDEILRIMDECNYRPQKIKTNYNMIVYVCDDQAQLESNYGSLLFSGMTQAAFLSGYRIILLPYERQFRSRTYLKQTLRSYGVAGVISFLKKTDEPFYETLVQAEVPHIVFTSHQLSVQGVNRIEVANEHGGYLAARHLLQHGHSTVAVFSRPDREDDEARIRGFARGVSEAGGGELYRLTDDPQKQDIEHQIMEMLRLREDVTAAFSTNYITTLKMLKVLRELHVEVPDAMSIVSFGDYEFTSYLNPALTSIRIPAKEMGRLAVEKLISLIAGESDQPLELQIDTEMVVRDSVKTLG